MPTGLIHGRDRSGNLIVVDRWGEVDMDALRARGVTFDQLVGGGSVTAARRTRATTCNHVRVRVCACEGQLSCGCCGARPLCDTHNAAATAATAAAAAAAAAAGAALHVAARVPLDGGGAGPRRARDAHHGRGWGALRPGEDWPAELNGCGAGHGTVVNLDEGWGLL